MNSYNWKELFIFIMNIISGLSPTKMNCTANFNKHVIPSNNHTPLLHVRMHCLLESHNGHSYGIIVQNVIDYDMIKCHVFSMDMCRMCS